MKKFTEGPWKWADNYFGLFQKATGKDILEAVEYEGMHVAYHGEDGMRAANARLIRQSPEMYEALERILFRCNSFLDDERDMSQDSIAAIAMICTQELKKARGEEC